MSKFRSGLIFVVTILCVVSLAVSASAASSKSLEAGEFGVLSGKLYDSVYNDLAPSIFFQYEFSYETRVTVNPGESARLYATIECRNNSTGALIFGETMESSSANPTRAGYYIAMDHFSNIKGENAITVAALGAHEARYTYSYVVYTSRTYNLERDHGVT